MPTLELKRVQFYSDADESAFFAFARSIKAVQRIEGAGDSMLLHGRSRPSQQSVRDLRALFARYRISRPEQVARLFGATSPSKDLQKNANGGGTRTV